MLLKFVNLYRSCVTSESKFLGALRSLKPRLPSVIYSNDFINYMSGAILQRIWKSIDSSGRPKPSQFRWPHIIKYISTMDAQVDREYVLTDIMKKRKKDQATIESKIKNKIALKGKRKKNADALKAPEKFIKQYQAQQKSYSHYKLKNRKNLQLRLKSPDAPVYGTGRLLLVVRLRGTTDISRQQSLILAKLNLRKINTAVFLKGTPTAIRQLKKVENYITWGEPSKKLVSELIYKKLYGKVGEERVHIKSNAQVEEHIGGDIICLEDIINEINNVGPHFKRINNFIFPFKLTTPEGTLASRIRKPITDNGHWGYRGEDINQYVELMI